MIAGLLFCNSLDFFSTNFASEKNITEDLMVAGSNPAGAQPWWLCVTFAQGHF